MSNLAFILLCICTSWEVYLSVQCSSRRWKFDAKKRCFYSTDETLKSFVFKIHVLTKKLLTFLWRRHATLLLSRISYTLCNFYYFLLWILPKTMFLLLFHHFYSHCELSLLMKYSAIKLSLMDFLIKSLDVSISLFIIFIVLSATFLFISCSLLQLACSGTELISITV